MHTTNMVKNIGNIKDFRMVKGVKVINMANTKKDFGCETRNATWTNDVEPTEEELKQIAEDEYKTLIDDDEFFYSGANDVNVFGRGEADYYFSQVSKMKICTPEEEVEYFKRIAAGDMKARDEFVERNLKLVLSNAKYRSQQTSCFSLMDLIQEGNLGLLKAIERFDVSKGYKFSTYATWWIRQAMSRGIAEQSRVIRIPVHMVECINRYKRVSRDFVQNYGREPSVAEMAKELGISVERANEFAKRCEEPVSLSAPVGEDDDSTLAEFIESDEPSIEEQYEKREINSIVKEMLETLSEKEREVLMERYGIGTGEPKTLEEVGKKFNVTRERIRQIEAKAIRKLKRTHTKVIKTAFIEDYLE